MVCIEEKNHCIMTSTHARRPCQDGGMHFNNIQYVQKANAKQVV